MMDSQSQQIFMRMKLHDLMTAHPDWTARQLADELKASERWVRKWIGRYRRTKKQSFRMYFSRSTAPKRRPRKTTDAVKDIIIDLRRELSETYHRKAGAPLILWGIKQRPHLFKAGEFVPTSTTTITKILNERGHILRPKQRLHIPLDLPEPMEEWEMDFGEITLPDGTVFEFFLVVDRGTSRVIYLEGRDNGYDAESALEAVARLLVLHGLPKRLRFDRDPRFVASWSMDSYPAALVRFLLAFSITPVVCPPRRPDLKPVVERCIRTLREEWLERTAIHTIFDAHRALEGFAHYHNHQRPHQGRACKNQTPDEAFPNLPVLPHLPETVDPDAWLVKHDKRGYRRRITSDGTIQIDKHTYYIDVKRAKQPVLVLVDAEQKVFHVMSGHEHVASKRIKGLHGEEMDFQTYLIVMKQEARSVEAHRNLLWRRRNDSA